MQILTKSICFLSFSTKLIVTKENDHVLNTRPEVCVCVIKTVS